MSQAIERAETVKADNKREFLAELWRKTADVVEAPDMGHESRSDEAREFQARLCRQTADLIEPRADVREVAEKIADRDDPTVEEIIELLEQLTPDEEDVEPANPDAAPEELAGDESRDEIEQRAESLAESLGRTDAQRRKRENERKHREAIKEGPRAGPPTQEEINRRRARERDRKRAGKVRDELDKVEQRSAGAGDRLSESEINPGADTEDTDPVDELEASLEGLR